MNTLLLHTIGNREVSTTLTNEKVLNFDLAIEHITDLHTRAVLFHTQEQTCKTICCDA